MPNEHRATVRENVALVLMLADGSLAVTRNVSASGLCVQLALNQQLASCVDVKMGLASAGVTFIGEGTVVRRQVVDGTERVAIKFTSARLISND